MADIHRLAAEIGAVLLLFAVLGIGLAMIAATSASAQDDPDGGNVTVDPEPTQPVEETPESDPCQQIRVFSSICWHGSLSGVSSTGCVGSGSTVTLPPSGSS